MNSEGNHPAARFEADLHTVQGRATAAMIALGLTAVSRIFSIPVQLWQSSLLRDAQYGSTPSQESLQLSDTLMSTSALATLALLIVTGVLFLRWLHKSVALTRALGGDTLRWTPREAVTGFIIPFINIARPYQIVRDLHDHLAPDVVPEPAAQAVADASTNYREVRLEAPPPPVKLPHAAIGAWWGFFWVGNVFANIAARTTGEDISTFIARNTLNTISDSFDIVSATLAVVMVRGVTARLAERYRRVRYNSPEALHAAGIDLDAPTL